MDFVLETNKHPPCIQPLEKLLLQVAMGRSQEAVLGHIFRLSMRVDDEGTNNRCVSLQILEFGPLKNFNFAHIVWNNS